MEPKFKVSVIIPVYNAGRYVKKAVESAVHLDEVGEVILVEDKSPDNALVICRQLEREYEKVKLFRHPNGENRGAGASRNLGIEKASCEYISFLDADDYYLDNRFEIDKIKLSDKSIDGVYSAAQIINLNKPEYIKLYTITKNIDPDELFYYLLRGTYGHYCTNGITLKKELLIKLGGFKSDLVLHQDSELWLRCALKGKIVAGNIKVPTSIVVTHGENRITSLTKETKLRYLTSLMQDISIREVGLINYSILLRKSLRNVESSIGFLKILRKIKI